MLDLLFFLLLGHYMGDFAFQTGRMAKYKPTSTVVLTQHVLVYTLTLTSFLYLGLYLHDRPQEFFTWTTLGVMLFVFVEHWFQDLVKGSRFNGVTQVFFLDQALHIIIIYLMRLFVYHG